MPQIVAAALAQSAMAAPAAAAATTAATTGAAAATTAAAQTAALEAAKQAAIQTGMKQAGVEAAKQAGVEAAKQAGIEATKQAGIEAAKQGIAQTAQQGGVEAAKKGIFSNPAGMPPTAGAPITPTAPATTLPPAGGAPNTMSANLSNQGIMTDAGLQGPGVEILPAKPGMSVEQAQALNEQIAYRPPLSPFKSNVPSAQGPVPEFITPDVGLPQGSPLLPQNSTFARAAADKGTSLSQLTTTPVDELMGVKETAFPLAPKSALEQGFETALRYAKDNPDRVGMGLMTLGQYMNQPKKEDKDKYKNTVDMSGFQPTIASVEPFKPSYEYQKYAAEGGLMKYAVGGPVETMSAQNAVGGNMMYPQAGLQTALYSNPMVQRPEAVNVISPGEGPAVGAYTGEQKFAEGGLSEAQRREYGLQTRAQRASRSLSKTYEEMEAEREKELMKLLGERSDPGIIPRSRTQQLSSPFSAAMAEHARLAKKNKVPVTPMAKTSLGDIDTYMDTPIEAAGGGIMYGLGGYSDGGRLLRGPGDGVSDSIPAVIGKRQPARLADGEFVIPARIVSELGNGSTEAGARKLYAMMERVQKSRKKSIGKKKVAVNSKADKHLPA
jgi:hypothetical protein